MIPNPKYGVLVLTVKEPLYDHFDELRRKTMEENGIVHKFVYNSTKSSTFTCKQTNNVEYKNSIKSIVEKTLGCVKHPSVPFMLDKFLWAYKKIRNDSMWSDVDYIVRANSSTFINFEKLEEWLAKLPRKECYAGAIVDEIFVSGTTIVFSKDLLDILIDTKFTLKERRRLDDVAIGLVMKRLNFLPINMPMMHFTKNVRPSEIDFTEASQYPLVRVRNDEDRSNLDHDIWDTLSRVTSKE